MEEIIFCYLFCFWQSSGHVICSYCEYCLKSSWLTTLRLKSSFHIWGFLYTISATWIWELQVVVEMQFEGIKHRHRIIVLEEASAVTHQICAADHRKRHCFVLTVCWVHLLSTCSSHTAVSSVPFQLVYASCSASPGTRWRMALPPSPHFPL